MARTATASTEAKRSRSRNAGLILAAGGGTRFGDQPKLLAQLEDRPVLEHAIRAQCAVEELDQIVVVLGANAAGILAAVEFDHAEPVICEDWREGIATSLRCGLRELQAADRVIVTLGDQPLVTADVIRLFLRAAPGTRATYNGVPGHPVVLGAGRLRAIEDLTGDRGARDLLRDAPTIECGHLCSGRDIDTREDLEAIRDEARAVL